MPESSNDQLGKFQQMYNASSPEKRAAICWLLANFEFVDQLTDTYVLSESDIQNLLTKSCSKTADYILKFILLFQQFKQENTADTDPAE